jgi:pectinesterase
VSKDSSGQFRTINEALQAAVVPPVGRFIIFLKEGIYEETVQIERKHVIIIGEGAGRSVVTGGKSVALHNLSMPETATMSK